MDKIKRMNNMSKDFNGDYKSEAREPDLRAIKQSLSKKLEEDQP